MNYYHRHWHWFFGWTPPGKQNTLLDDGAERWVVKLVLFSEYGDTTFTGQRVNLHFAFYLYRLQLDRP